MAKCDKTKHTCNSTTYATCVKYELEVPEFSDLHEEPCLTIEETTDDLYNISSKIKEEIDLSALGEKCLEYVEDEDNKIIVKNALLLFEEEICNLKEEIETLKTTDICNRNISECLNLEGLVDQCDLPITTLSQLLQYLVDQTQTGG